MENYIDEVIRFVLDDDIFIVDGEDTNVDQISAESD